MLVLGVLPGVMLAVALSLAWLLMVASRPRMPCSAACPACRAFTASPTTREARTVPGLLLYRFEANLVFFNVDYFGERLRAAIEAAKTPVEWVIVDASPINWIDATALQRLDELHGELAARGITLGVARARLSLGRAFDRRWVSQRLAATGIAQVPDAEGCGACFRASQARRRPDDRAAVAGRVESRRRGLIEGFLRPYRGGLEHTGTGARRSCRRALAEDIVELMTLAIGLARRRSLPQVSACSDIRSGKVGQRQEEGRGPDGSCK